MPDFRAILPLPSPGRAAASALAATTIAVAAHGAVPPQQGALIPNAPELRGADGDGAAAVTRQEFEALADEVKEVRAVAGGTAFSYGGYVQLDTITSAYSGGKPANELIEDFLVPSLIPVEPAGGADTYRSTNMHAKSSRFFFKTATDTEVGRVSSHIELDFILSEQGDERISNSWSGRIRSAFVTWEQDEDTSLMAGQNWSTFFNVAALPDHLDFVGPVGTAFMRQPQIRWTSGPLQLAVENAATRLTGASFDNESEGFPDLIARYNGRSGDLSWSLATMLRQFNYEDRTDLAVRGANDSRVGYAASLSGVWRFGDDDLRFMGSYGDALGRYLGLNSFNDGYVNAAGEIRAIEQYGAFAAYRRAWNPHWHSTFGYSLAGASNPDLGAFVGAMDLAKGYRSAHASLNYVPAPRLRFGVELIWAERELEDGRSGDVSRVQLSIQHAF